MNFFKELISDEKGCISSKRVAGILCVLALVFCLVFNTIFPENKPSDTLVDAVALFAFGAFGLTSFDKYSVLKSKKSTESKTEE